MRRVPAISRAAEHTTFADGYNAVNFAAACAGLPTVCAAAPALTRFSSKITRSGRCGLGKTGIPGRLTRGCGRFWRMAARIDSRLSVLVSIVPPMREIPLAKGLLRHLGLVSFAPP